MMMAVLIVFTFYLHISIPIKVSDAYVCIMCVPLHVMLCTNKLVSKGNVSKVTLIELQSLVTELKVLFLIVLTYTLQWP